MAAIFELLAAFYGGYFEGGVGIMHVAMLAALAMTGQSRSEPPSAIHLP